MKLYLIIAQATTYDADGPFNMDLFVSAKSSRSAVNLWKKYYAEGAPGFEADDGEVRVFEVPAMSSTPTAHAWEKIERKQIKV